MQRLDESPVDHILVSDTIPTADLAPKKLVTVSVAGLVAQAIRSIHAETSVSSLFE